MEIKSHNQIPDVKILRPKKIGDSRGFFSEIFRRDLLLKNGIEINFVQDNQSLSSEAFTLRGLHFQSPPYAQDKLVRVINGSIIDIAVDIRKNSPTYGEYISVKLSSEELTQILVPAGFAHGFITLESNTEILYKVSNYYSKDHDHGILWSDSKLNIDWQVQEEKVILSEKDQNQPTFDKASKYF